MAKSPPCEWTSQREAFRAFTTEGVVTESAEHIKPLHWYIASRLVVEGGFHPDYVTPHPPFRVEGSPRAKGGARLVYDPTKATANEQVILGGLKTKNVDVVVDVPHVGPVVAVSCKGTTKSFRNLTNRMEETIGECTNLHITYPAMVIGYFALLRANRTLQDAAEAPDIPAEDSVIDQSATVDPSGGSIKSPSGNDLALDSSGDVVNSIVNFHNALRDMTGRRGIRDEISRYESMAVALVEPRGKSAGLPVAHFPEASSPLHLDKFFKTLYQSYEERFVIGAPLLATRGVTTRLSWANDSLAFISSSTRTIIDSLEYTPRFAD